jgi:hypothetical protein
MRNNDATLYPMDIRPRVGLLSHVTTNRPDGHSPRGYQHAIVGEIAEKFGASSGVTTPSQPKSFKLVIRNFAIVRSDSAIRTQGLLMSQLYPQPAFETANWPKYWEQSYR